VLARYGELFQFNVPNLCAIFLQALKLAETKQFATL